MRVFASQFGLSLGSINRQCIDDDESKPLGSVYPGCLFRYFFAQGVSQGDTKNVAYIQGMGRVDACVVGQCD